jgi:DNA-binding ferritin-like protein (Dps family)
MEEIVTNAIRMDVIGKDADDFIDNLYKEIKGAFMHKGCGITTKHLEALAEQLTELAARKKEEESGE